MMRRDLDRLLARAFAAHFAAFAGEVRIDTLSTAPWASVTFAGTRHRLRLTLTGPGAVGTAADFLADLHDMDLPVPGHIVADLALLTEARRDGGSHAWLELEVLTIEDAAPSAPLQRDPRPVGGTTGASPISPPS